MKIFFLLIVFNYSLFLFSQDYQYTYQINVPNTIFYFCENDTQDLHDTTIIEIIDLNGNKINEPINYYDTKLNINQILNSNNGYVILDSANFNLDFYVLHVSFYSNLFININKYHKRIVILIGPANPIGINLIVSSIRPLNNNELMEIRESLLNNKKSKLEIDKIVKIGKIL